MSARKQNQSKQKALLGAGKRGGWTFRDRLRRASLTVEAAIALPLFFFCVLTLISFLDMYRISMVHTVQLQQEAEELGRIRGAAGGGDLLDEIDLYESVPWSGGLSDLFGTRAGIACRARVSAWTGRGAGEGNTAGIREDQLVYVTENRSVYHTDSRCTHLSLSTRAVNTALLPTLRNDYGEHYHACEKCAAGRSAAGISYITAEGDHYHYDETCSGLTRSVRLTRLSYVEGLHICSRCAAREEA